MQGCNRRRDFMSAEGFVGGIALFCFLVAESTRGAQQRLPHCLNVSKLLLLISN